MDTIEGNLWLCAAVAFIPLWIFVVVSVAEIIGTIIKHFIKQSRGD